ncbi:hypothetical protein [Saccharopolyspora mangrovi]|uniref:Uncharacterized protein n=1 Tax=Saccharopolyspora mangrovi TaxID=3082379 RepID=A0ABU6AGH8_9PSEU|nr:hypothetical protein [Saccharopolyspora sp. S2-29]MEB3370499.1 hypothetical protein [Saccharopolyspora sp. S2-29]
MAKKLAERWVALLVLPGALFTMVVWLGVRLGQWHALDHAKLTQVGTEAASYFSHQSLGFQLMVVASVLLASSGVGLVTQALAGPTRVLYLGSWPRFLTLVQRWRVARRRRRWHRRVQHRRTLEQRYPASSRTPEQQQEINTAAERVTDISGSEPGRPTWMGDRIHSLEQIALHRYGLDLTFAWPRLWLVFPDTVRTEITAANAAFAAAVATATWAWPYLLLGAVWWPSAVIGAGVAITGWTRARAALIDLTALSEAALDLHGRNLANALGITNNEGTVPFVLVARDQVTFETSTHPLTLAEGEQITTIVRKGR